MTVNDELYKNVKFFLRKANGLEFIFFFSPVIRLPMWEFCHLIRKFSRIIRWYKVGSNKANPAALDGNIYELQVNHLRNVPCLSSSWGSSQAPTLYSLGRFFCCFLAMDSFLLILNSFPVRWMFASAPHGWLSLFSLWLHFWRVFPLVKSLSISNYSMFINITSKVELISLKTWSWVLHNFYFLYISVFKQQIHLLVNSYKSLKFDTNVEKSKNIL